MCYDERKLETEKTKEIERKKERVWYYVHFEGGEYPENKRI